MRPRLSQYQQLELALVRLDIHMMVSENDLYTTIEIVDDEGKITAFKFNRVGQFISIKHY